MKDKAKQKKVHPQTNAAPKKANATRSIPSWIWLLAILLLTILAFWPNNTNQLTTWDDDVYIYDNKAIKEDLTWKALNKTQAGNWQPGLVAQLWAEYHLFGLKTVDPNTELHDNNVLNIKVDPVYDGTVYHTVNLIMHLLNAIFLFLFFREFGRSFFARQDIDTIALLGTLIFCIHPMHAESVCWASETKDVGYAMWYHAALWVFCIYTDRKQLKYLLLTIILFSLSLIYKGQAVILPVALVLVAIAKTQNDRSSNVFNWFKAVPAWIKGLKIPDYAFFVIAFSLSLVVSRLAFAAQAEMHFLEHKDIKNMPGFDRGILTSYGLGNYILKTIIPYGLSMYHSYPRKNGGLFEWDVYAIAILPLILLALLGWLRRNVLATFAILFFLVHILPVSQFIAVGASIYWDRYSYISYDGFILLAASLAVLYYRRNKVVTTAVVSCFLLVFTYMTYERTKVWHDSKTLYSDALEQKVNSDNPLLNGCLGMVYYSEGDMVNAKKYLDRSIAFSTESPGVMATRAHIYVGSIRPDMPLPLRLSMLDSAIMDCRLAIAGEHDSANAYGGLGICYSMKGDMTGQKIMFDSARLYLQSALQFHGPDSADICLNIGHSYNNGGKFDSALIWYTRSLRADSTQWAAYIRRGMILYQKGNEFWPDALRDLKVAEIHDANPANKELAKNFIRAISGGDTTRVIK